ncbi:MAG: hypothetical protein AB7E72_01525 [Lysobacterales bacterium]
MSLVLAGTFFPSAAAFGERFSNTQSARQAAEAYSEETGGVGVVISYGTGNSISPEALAESINNEIKRRGHLSRIFIVTPDHVGVGFIYQVGDWSSGMLASEAAVAAMDNVIKRAEIHERIVFLEARMAQSRAQLIEKYGANYLEEMERRWLDDR